VEKDRQQSDLTSLIRLKNWEDILKQMDRYERIHRQTAGVISLVLFQNKGSRIKIDDNLITSVQESSTKQVLFFKQDISQ
jgi:hypothetical protein